MNDKDYELKVLRKAYELMADELSTKNKCAFQKCSKCHVNEECHNKNWIMDFYWNKAERELYKEACEKEAQKNEEAIKES